MKTSRCCGRCFYSNGPFWIRETGWLVSCRHPQEHISGGLVHCSKPYWQEKPCFWSNKHLFGRVQNENGSWRPDVPILFLIFGGLFFRLAWKTVHTGTLFVAMSLHNSNRKMTMWQRWNLFVLENYAYWDQFAELSAADLRGTKK